jgi:hypothetical protein
MQACERARAVAMPPPLTPSGWCRTAQLPVCLYCLRWKLVSILCIVLGIAGPATDRHISRCILWRPPPT